MYQLVFDFGRPAVSGLPIRTHFVSREEFIRAAADLMVKGGYFLLDFTKDSYQPIDGYRERLDHYEPMTSNEYLSDTPTAKAWDWMYDLWEGECCPIGVVFDPLYFGM